MMQGGIERDVVMISLFAGVIAVLGLIPKLTVGFGVPITAQSLGVMLCGSVLGARRGALAVVLFLVVVALGLPLLAGGRGGIGAFLTPAAGFLIGWPFAAFVTGVVVAIRCPVPLVLMAMLASVCGGIVVCYGFGIVGMAMMLEVAIGRAAVLAGVFVPGDLAKAVIAGLLTSALARVRPGVLLWRSSAAAADG